MITLTLAEIVDRLGGDVHGDATTPVSRIATLENAVEGAIAFVSNPKYEKMLSQTRAAAVILTPGLVERCLVPSIATPQPYLYFARLAQLLNPPPRPGPGLHPTASSESDLPPSVSVGAGSRIGSNVKLGAHVTIGAGCIIEDDVEIGAESMLHSSCTVRNGTRIGRHAILHPGVVIGADGFGFAREQDGAWVKIPQTGGVLIGDDVEIGANTCIDRGAIEDTVIEDGVKIDNLVQVAHNVRIGAHTAIAGCTGIAGSVIIGKRCTIAGASNIIGHIEIGDDVNILVASTITKSLPRAGTYAGAVPSMRYDDWQSNYSRLRHLEAMADKIRALEKRIAELEKNQGETAK